MTAWPRIQTRDLLHVKPVCYRSATTTSYRKRPKFWYWICRSPHFCQNQLFHFHLYLSVCHFSTPCEQAGGSIENIWFCIMHVDVANPSWWWFRVCTSNMQPLCPQTEVHFYKRMNENEWEHAKTGNEWGPQEFRFFGVSKKGLPAATVTIKSEELVANSITPTKSFTTHHIRRPISFSKEK